MGSERVCGGRVCWGGECARRGGLAVREGPLASGGEYNQALRPPTPMGCCRAGMEDEGLPGQCLGSRILLIKTSASSLLASLGAI